MSYLPPCDYYYRQPNYINAYPIDIPVFINRENINKLPYKALNYEPGGAEPVVYVPVAYFSKFGAKVYWHEGAKTISVVTDETVEEKLNALKAGRMAYGEISKGVETPAQHLDHRYNGMVYGKFVFDGIWWNGDAADAATLTVGRYYIGDFAGVYENFHFIITNDQGDESTFYRSRRSLAREGIVI